MILNAKFFGSLLLCLMVTSFSIPARASLIDKCKALFTNMKNANQPVSAADLQNNIYKLDERLQTSSPFGQQHLPDREGIRKVLNRHGVDWEGINEIDKSIVNGTPLTKQQETKFESLAQRTMHIPETGRNDNDENLSVKRVALKRLLDIKNRANPPESKNSKDSNSGKSSKDQKPQDQKNNENNKESQDQNESGQNSSQQNNQKEKSQDQKSQNNQNQEQKQNQGNQNQDQKNDNQNGGSGQEQKQEQKENQGSGEKQEQHPQEHKQNGGREQQPQDQKHQSGQQHQQPQKSQNMMRDLKEEKNENPQKEHKAEENQDGATPPRPVQQYRNAKEVSDAVLKYLYVWELRKYDSIYKMESGLQNFFNFLQSTSGQFDSKVAEFYRALTEKQLQNIAKSKNKYTNLTDFNLSLNMAANGNRTEELYQNSLELLQILNEIKKVDRFTAQEHALHQKLELLLKNLRSKHDRSDQILAEDFYNSLPGGLSRATLTEQFGKELLTPGSPAFHNFTTAIKSGSLWSYRLMGLLKPYLNAKHKKLYVFRPQMAYQNRTSRTSNGEDGIRLTDDPSNFDKFVQVDSLNQLRMNLADGVQKMKEPRMEINRPVISKEARSKVSIIATDVSPSMTMPMSRTIGRNMMVAGYFDFHFSELMTDMDVINKTNKNVGSHTMYQFDFAENVGQEIEIKTRARAQQLVSLLASKPKTLGQGGGTSIQLAIMNALRLVKAAKGKDPRLSSASILLITDGDDSHINFDQIQRERKLIDDSGETKTDVIINVVVLGPENQILKRIALNHVGESESQDQESLVTYKHMTDDQMKARIKESETLPKLNEHAKMAPISAQDFAGSREGYDARALVAEITKVTPLIKGEEDKITEESSKVKKLKQIFGQASIPRSNTPAAYIKKSHQILEVAEGVVDQIPKESVPKNIRAVLLMKIIEDLCHEKQLHHLHFAEAMAHTEFRQVKIKISLWLGLKE